MFAGNNIRRITLALVIVMALVAIAIPTARMIGCDMSMGGMPFMPVGAGFYNDCPGEWVTSTGPAGVTSNGLLNLVLTLASALMVAAIVFSPSVSARPVRVVLGEPPGPPSDPRGQRTRI